MRRVDRGVGSTNVHENPKLIAAFSDAPVACPWLQIGVREVYIRVSMGCRIAYRNGAR